MEIIDAQVHTWMTDRPQRPWAADYRDKLGNKWTYLLHAGQTNTNEMAVLEMAEVGVDAALLSPVGVYGPDNSYEFEAVATFPRKFRVVGWIDWLADDVEERLARWRSRRGWSASASPRCATVNATNAVSSTAFSLPAKIWGSSSRSWWFTHCPNR